MSLEMEVKLRVPSHEPILARLRELGGKELARVTEINRIFDRPDGSLRDGGCGLRIRTARSANSTSVTTLTFKGAVIPGSVKVREEIETRVDNAESAISILSRLGFVPILDFEKRRQIWQWGDCFIDLDEPPFLGLFVEIEGPSVKAIAAVQQALGLSSVAHEPSSYVCLLLEYCAHMRVSSRVLRLNEQQTSDRSC